MPSRGAHGRDSARARVKLPLWAPSITAIATSASDTSRALLGSEAIAAVPLGLDVVGVVGVVAQLTA